MKFNIYYGAGDDFAKQELINSFDTIDLAEKFLFDYIKENHPNSGYIRTNLFLIQEDNMTMDIIQKIILLFSKIKKLN